MKATTQEDLHFDAFVWKAELQSLGQTLDCCDQRLMDIEDNNGKMEYEECTKKLRQDIQDVRDKIEYIEQRIAQFENRLAIAVECYACGCETLFYDEVEIIQTALQKLNGMVDAIQSELNSSTKT